MNFIKAEPKFLTMFSSDSFMKFSHDEALNQNLPTLINIKKETFDPDNGFHNVVDPSTSTNYLTDNIINIKTEPASVLSLPHNNIGLSSETLSSIISYGKNSVELNLNQFSTSIIKHESKDIKVESHGELDSIIPDLETSLISIKDESCEKFENVENFTQNECLVQSGNIFCNICGQNFINLHSLNHHRKEVHEITVHLKIQDWKCNLCDKYFSTKGNLKVHENLVHLKIQDWKCNLCNRYFSNKSSLKKHEKTVHLKIRDLKCNFCNKYFGRPEGLKLHKKAVHLKIRDLKCNFCDKYFADKANLNKHEKLVHLKIKNWKCNLCDKYFISNAKLKVHENSVHLKIRSWKCNICEKSFTRKHHLKDHRRVHISDFSEVCDICNKSFRHLRSHKNHVHSKILAKNFKCTHCDKIFLKKSNLKQHMIMHSDVRD